MKKKDLPSKICFTCKRSFTWRKKWKLNWASVKYCSKRCSGNKINYVLTDLKFLEYLI